MFEKIQTAVIAAAPTPIDYTSFAPEITTPLGGLAAGLMLVVGGALAVKGITWGVPKLVRFFTRLAG